MKEYVANEGKVWKKGEEILGNILYTPDTFDDTMLEQVDRPPKEQE